MKKMFKIILVLLIVATLLYFGAKMLSNKVGNDINEFYKPFQNEKYFLKDIDFSDGEYALYIRHKDFGKFIVLDEEKIIANQKKIKIKRSFISFLPGEGDRDYGAILFKDKKRVKSKIGGAFKIFEIGTLNKYAIPVERERFSGTKKEVQQKIDTIHKNDYVFITHQPNFVADNRSFRFRVYFPSIAIPVTRGIDEDGHQSVLSVNGIEIEKWQLKEESIYHKKWSDYLEKCIREKADTISDFEISISSGSIGDAYIFETSKKWSSELRTEDKKMLYTNDYMYYDFTAYIMTNKKDAEKLIALDYSNCLSEKDRNRPQVISKMKELVKRSTKPNLSVDKGEVGLSDYKDSVTKDKEVYEQKYTLHWLELE